jgi:hypothetical protein
MNKLNPINKLIINIILSVYILYIAFMILSKIKINMINGLILALLGSLLLTKSMFNYLNEINETPDNMIDKLRGLNFNKNNPNYKPIGGIGGVGWV